MNTRLRPWLIISGLGFSLLLAGCASVVSFRVSPEADGSSLVSCLKSSTDACTFDIAGTGNDAGQHFTLAVGQDRSIAVPQDGVQVRGCTANQALGSCSRVTVGRETRTQAFVQEL